jgi:hypothetical protein
MLTVLILPFTSEAYAHGVGGGFGGRSPNYLLAIVMTSVAAFGLIPLICKSVGFRLSISLLLGSLVVLTFSAFGFAGWYYGLSDPPFSNLEVTLYLLLASLIGSIGGAIFTAYHYWAVRPYSRNMINKRYEAT